LFAALCVGPYLQLEAAELCPPARGCGSRSSPPHGRVIAASRSDAARPWRAAFGFAWLILGSLFEFSVVARQTCATEPLDHRHTISHAAFILGSVATPPGTRADPHEAPEA